MKNFILWIRIVLKTVIYGIKFLHTGDRSILRRWTSDILRISNVDVVCKGKFPDRPFIIMANHESYFDIFSMFYCCDFNLVWFAKKELFKLPIFGKALKRLNSIAVDRNNPKRDSIAVLRALKNMKKDESIVIFPQGTRKNYSTFKKGGILIAKKKNIHIVPVKITNSKNILSSDSWKINPGRITVAVLNEIDVENHSADEIENIIRSELYE